LTVTEVIAVLRVPRSTFYRWRQRRLGPPALRLPGGQLRVRRADLHDWIAGRAESTDDPFRAAR
jgi:excisionase family DNA binding protein